MSYNKPCVFGCNTKGVTVHRFPNYNKFPKRFQDWIKSAGDAITHLSYEYIQEDMRVCDRHFTESMKNRNKRLNTLAVPTLHLPVPEASQHQPDIENRVPPSTTPEVVEQFFIVDTPSTSKEYAPDNDGMASESNILRDITNVMAIDTGGNPVELQQTCLEIEPEGVSTNTSIHSMKQGIFYKMGRKGHLRHIPSNNVETRTHIRSLNNEIRRLRKRSMSYKTRLEKATKMSSQNAFQIISKNMSVASKIFTSMQYTQGGKKPKGRRFTLEEKILALTLYKRSPKAYALLYKYFTLPAGRSLKNLLAKIKIKPGINELIFEKIKETVSQMTETEKLCSLIFDEMALTPQIHFMSSSDEFKGFISYGKEDRLADKALVFMIKGLTKNYKQPVAYYFTENLNRFDLKQLIKNVINNVQATGLRVICTICDQSAVNVSAINSLISDSKITFIKKGMEWRHNMFYVNKCGIIPLYDVPHLLKGVRNNLLNKDIHFIDAKDGNKVKW